MPAPDYDWLPLTAVATQLGKLGPAAVDDAVDQARLAAAAYVERVRPDLVWLDAEPVDIPDDVRMGALLLAARWYARRQSPMGVANYAEFGPAQIVRLDPDVERLLGLGRHAKPRIG